MLRLYIKADHFVPKGTTRRGRVSMIVWPDRASPTFKTEKLYNSHAEMGTKNGKWLICYSLPNFFAGLTLQWTKWCYHHSSCTINSIYITTWITPDSFDTVIISGHFMMLKLEWSSAKSDLLFWRNVLLYFDANFWLICRFLKLHSQHFFFHFHSDISQF